MVVILVGAVVSTLLLIYVSRALLAQRLQISRMKAEERQRQMQIFGDAECTDDNSSDDAIDNADSNAEEQAELMRHRMTKACSVKPRVVFIGNMGAGKSTVINTLLGEAVMLSGISPGSGLTEKLDWREFQGDVYVDTPGLGDVEGCAEKAKQLSKALIAGGPVKIVLVVKTAAGRIRKEDLAVGSTVLDALARARWIGNGDLGIVYNDVPADYTGPGGNGFRTLLDTIEGRFCLGKGTVRRTVLQFHPQAHNANNVLLSSSARSEVDALIQRLCPFDTSGKRNVWIALGDYEQWKQYFERWMVWLWEEVPNAMKRDREENTPHTSNKSRTARAVNNEPSYPEFNK